MRSARRWMPFVVERPVRLAEGAYLEVVRPSAQLTVQPSHQLCGVVHKAGSVGVLASALAPIVLDTVKWARENARKKGNGPYNIAWERSEPEESLDLKNRLEMPERSTISDALPWLRALDVRYVASSREDWLTTQRRVLGRDFVTRTDVENVIEQALASSPLRPGGRAAGDEHLHGKEPRLRRSGRALALPSRRQHRPEAAPALQRDHSCAEMVPGSGSERRAEGCPPFA